MLVGDAGVHRAGVQVNPAGVAVASGIGLHAGLEEFASVGGCSGGLISIKPQQLAALRAAAERQETMGGPMQHQIAFVLVLFLTACGADSAQGDEPVPQLPRVEPQAPRVEPNMTDTPRADRPVPFGYKIAWYAVRTTDVRAVAKAVGLRRERPASWAEGIEAAHESETFVTPPVNGWVFVVSSTLAERISEQKPWTQLIALSSPFGEAQAFCSHRVVDLHVWAKALKGHLVRAYGYLGESGETIFDTGDQSAEERALGFRFFDERSSEANDDAYWGRSDLSYPDEDSVMAIARRWSLAPVDLDESFAEPMLGLLGNMK